MINRELSLDDLFFAYRPPHGEHYLADLNYIGRMKRANINTICFFAANTYSRVGVPYSPYPPIWEYEHEYNFDPLDRQIADILELNPAAKLICMVDMNSPLWLARLLRRDSYDELGNCAANPQWRELTFDYLSRFLTYAEEKYQDRIIAYVLACGKTTEWFDMRPEGDDFREEAFSRWCEAHGIDAPERIPSKKRRSIQAAHGIIRDPTIDADSISYWRFSNELVAQLAEDMITEARKHIRDDAQIGMFISGAMEGGKGVEMGRADYLKVFDTPGMNFSLAAGSPVARLKLEGHGLRDPLLSLKLRNMHHLVEIDQRTHTSNAKASKYVTLPDVYAKGWRSEELSVAGMKRDMAMCLINQTSLWFFNIFGGAYQTEGIWDAFALMKRVWDDYARTEAEERAEILLVIDNLSRYYMTDMKDDNGIGSHHLFNVRRHLNLIGAPYQTCSFEDIGKISDLSPYKLVVFINVIYMDDERHALLQEKVFRDNRTVLWQYAPGIIRNNVYDPENVEELCGSQYAKDGLQVRAFDGWKSVYLHDARQLNPGILRQLGEEASVHFYAPMGVGIHANSRLLMVNADDDIGTITVRLPHNADTVTELFSGKLIAENGDTWDEDFSAPDTRLYRLD